METPKISVLMPAYNAEKYIHESINSILKQTFIDFEFIIIDDASTDKTWQIIKTFLAKDKRIKIFRNRNNLSIVKTRNLLIKKAQGKYIAWQDADDISIDYRLEKQFRYMEKNPQVGIVGGYIQFFNDKGTQSIRRYEEDDIKLRQNIFKFSPVAQPAAMIKKECFDKVGLYDIKYPVAEDLLMSFKIGTNYQFANLPYILIKYRESNESTTYNRLALLEKLSIKIRFNYSHSIHYRMSIIDRIYNMIEYISIYLVPSNIKVKIFNFFRNSKNL